MITERMLRYSAIASLILLISCGGNGTSSQQQEADFAVTLISQQNGTVTSIPQQNVTVTLIPQQNVTRVEWDVPSHLNITGIRILLEEHSPNGTITIERQCLGSSSDHCTISNLSSDFVYSFTISLIHQDGSSQQIVQQELEVGPNYDEDDLIDRLDKDDDNDGVMDIVDNCPQGKIGWLRTNQNDIDDDGCRDRDEDLSLPGVSNLTIVPIATGIGLQLDWKNPSFPLDYVNISWEVGRPITRITGEILASGESLVFPTHSSNEYTLTIIPHYANGGKGEASVARARAGTNYDSDRLIDLLDEDDDNDGLPDTIDLCDNSPLGFRFGPPDDIDRDGCHDSIEDNSLPAISNLSSFSYEHQVGLSWTNPDPPLTNLSVQWTPDPDSRWLDANTTSVNISGLRIDHSYNFTIVTHFAGGLVGDPRSIEAPTGLDYDGDGQIDDLDEDDDNDGLADEQDSCPFSSPLGLVHLSDQDINGDGCQDRNRPDPLGLVNLTFMVSDDAVQFHWINPYSSYIVFLDVEWRAGSSIDGTLLTSLDKFTNLSVDDLTAGFYSFRFTTTYYNGARSPYSINIAIGPDYDNDRLVDLEDQDDDNDGVMDIVDNCPQGKIGWLRTNQNDIDDDGCRDRDEDLSLPGISNLTIVPIATGIGLQLDWKNPSFPLDYVNISWEVGRPITRITGEILASGESLVFPTHSSNEYTLTIIPHYANGGKGEASVARARAGTNYDSDRLIDLLDEDDDNDGLPDTIDLCDNSPLGFRFGPPDDIDKDGCHDSIEDNSLPAISNLSSFSYEDQVGLSWTNPDPPLTNLSVQWTPDPGSRWLDANTTSVNISGLRIDHSYNFTIVTHFAGGLVGDPRSIEAPTGLDYDGDGQIDDLDEDDDNDGLADEQDSCPFSSPLGLVYLSDQDINGDGCQDRNRPDPLGLTNLTFMVSDDAVQFHWINPYSSYIVFLDVEWRAGSSIDGTLLTSLDKFTNLSIDDLTAGFYSFRFTTTYYNGARSPYSINIAIGPDYDNDRLVDLEDQDDDNDGVMDIVDNCPQGKIGWLRTNQNDIDDDGCRNDEDQDDDNDGVMDEQDIDDDGDGLIEIATAESLFNIRYQLDGSGYRSSTRETINQQGCGDKELIDECFGYELTDDISLADFPNWLPLANDLNPYQAGFQGSAFTAIFDGNGYEISDLTIRRSSADYQALFGRLAGARVSRLGIRSIRIAGGHATASLAGEAINSIISDSVVSQASLRAKEEVGSLVGRGRSTTILSSSSINNDVAGFSQTSGGLIGRGDQLTIRNSFNINSTVFSPRQAGGLIGSGSNIRIDSSALIGAKISGSIQSIGGLVGQATNISIHNSSNYHSLILTSQRLGGGLIGTGGFIGVGEEIAINASSLELASVYGGKATGGLIGEGKHITIFSSFIGNASIDGNEQTGGLIGSGSNIRIDSSALIGTRISGSIGTRAYGFGGPKSHQGVGGLVGQAKDISIHNSSNYNSLVLTSQGLWKKLTGTGGFIGMGEEVVINASSSELISINGGEATGGLIGEGEHTTILFSFINNATIHGNDQTGGFIGGGSNIHIDSSALIGSRISGSIGPRVYGFKISNSYQGIGGLVGQAKDISIHNSSNYNSLVLTSQGLWKKLTGTGGFIGMGEEVVINASSLELASVYGGKATGGLIGEGEHTTILFSFINNATIHGNDQTGGFIGGGSNIHIDSSALIGSRISGSIGPRVYGFKISNSYQGIGGLVGQAVNISIHNSSNYNNLVLTSQGLREKLTGTGGFIGIGEEIVINASSLELASVQGDRATGGLIGEGKHITISFSLVDNTTIYGSDQTGGLIGKAQVALIISTAVQQITVQGDNGVGGLVGDMNTRHKHSWTFSRFNEALPRDHANFVYASRVTDGIIRGSTHIGGMIGTSNRTLVLASYGEGLNINGNKRIGGLAGDLSASSLLSSYITASRLSWANCAGGLIGFSTALKVFSSYAAVSQAGHNNVCHLNAAVSNSYIDRQLASNSTQLETLQSTQALQQPISYSGIYADWDRGVNLNNADGDDSGIEFITVWCDKDFSGRIEPSEQDPANLLWNFGGSNDYPSLDCSPIVSNPFNNAGNQDQLAGNQDQLAGRADQTVLEASPTETNAIFDRIQQGTHNTYGSARDPLIGFQWYLNRTGINRVWEQGHTGSGVHVSLVDTGMELFHEDLIQNVVAGASRNFRVPEDHIYRNNPQSSSAHGTASAGTIAAKGDNGIGIKGMAPDAGIYAYTTGGRSDSEYLASLMPTTPQTAVSANVRGSFGVRLVRFRSGIYSLIEDLLEDQINTGFYGTGMSYTIAAHNGRATGGSAHYMALRNHRAFINVCAIGPENKYASYSNPGANLWLCGPSNDNQASLPVCRDPIEQWRCRITTTDISGDDGWNSVPSSPARGGVIERSQLRATHTNFGGGDYYIRENNGSLTYLPPIAGSASYTQNYGGTSASTPIVSGAIAVLRAAYPHLSWRDVKLILAESAEQLDKDNPFWQVGAAAYHNHSQHYTHSIDYGFGMIDMVAAMKLARQWQLLPNELRLASPRGFEFLAPSTQSTIRVPSSRQLDFIEHIDVDIDIDYYGNMRDLDIVLRSPHGTLSILSRRYGCVDTAEEECDKGVDWTFGTAAHLGEDPVGEWTLSVNLSSWDPDSSSWQPLDRDISHDHISLGWQLIFYGHNKEDRQNNPTPPGPPFLPPEDLNP